MFSFTEDTFEQAVIELFENMGYTHIYAPDMDRTDYSRPLLDTAITLVSIAVGVYIAAVSALLGSPYAKELKQETDKKKTGNTLLGTLQDYFRCAGKFGVVTIIVSCLYCIPSTYIIPARIMRIGSAIAYGVFSCNILFLWLVFIFLVNSLEKSV